MLEKLFKETASVYTGKRELVYACWQEVETAYNADGRYYHTLRHLEQLCKELSGIRQWVEDWDSVVFATFYHDIVYDAAAQDNERRSAELAGQRLQALNVPEESIIKCRRLIMATKFHAEDEDKDICFFTDADLSVLGQPWSAYSDYFHQIRKEYAVYPDPIYYSGRMNVLEHFLRRKAIFKTAGFFERYEKKARRNIEMEIQFIRNLQSGT